jgi:hypothetical protein
MVSSEPDKDDRTKNMRQYDERRQKRADRLFHWSLDMPPAEDDVDVRVSKNTGLGWKELMVIAAAGLGGYAMLTKHEVPAPIVSPPPAAVAPAEPLRGKIRFWTEDGTQIEQRGNDG